MCRSGGLPRFGVVETVKHGAEVVLFAMAPDVVLVAVRDELFEPGEVVASMAECVLGSLSRLVEPFTGVLADRFEQEEALATDGFEQALVEERGDLVEVC